MKKIFKKMKVIPMLLIASLIINTVLPKSSPFMSFAEDPNSLQADGFASQNGGTTGGKGGQTKILRLQSNQKMQK